jgi:hypothetical protein
MHKLFNLTTVASGAAIGMILAGVLALVGGGYANSVVHDPALPASLNQFAGQQVVNGTQAKAFANKYIAVHLKEIGGGQTYSQVSAQFLKDPTNAKLGQERQTLFMGETLRGMLLGAWGWSMVGTVATIAGVVLIGIGGVLLAIPVAAAVAARRRRVAVPAGRAASATPAA